MESDSLAGRGLGDAVARTRIRSIPLEHFFRVLEFSIVGTDENAFETLRVLRNHGLELTAGEEGYVGHGWPIHPGDISVALAKVKRAYQADSAGELDDAAHKAWETPVLVASGTPSECHLEIGELWVDRRNYASACRSLGLDRFLWPKALWTESAADLEAYHAERDVPLLEMLPLQGDADHQVEAVRPPSQQEGAPRGEEALLYPQARHLLAKRWHASDEEIAVWIGRGDLQAWWHAGNPDGPLESFHPALMRGEANYRELLPGVYLSKPELDTFTPNDRYLTGAQVIERWRKYVDRDSAREVLRVYSGPDMENLSADTLTPEYPLNSVDRSLEGSLFNATQVEHFEQGYFPERRPVQQGADAPPAEAGIEPGFLPLAEAVNLLVGQPRQRSMSGNPGRPLWEAALSALQSGRDWPLAHRRRDEGLRSEMTCVRVAEFLEWAQEQTANGHIPEGCDLWTPARLAEEFRRLEGLRDRGGTAPTEADDAQRRIQRVEDLLRRFAEVGLRIEPPQRGQAAAVDVEARARTKTTRKTRLRIAVEEGRAVLLRKRKREPTAYEVISYLGEHNPTGAVADWKDDVVTWEDQQGKLHDTRLKSVANMLTAIRKDA